MSTKFCFVVGVVIVVGGCSSPSVPKDTPRPAVAQPAAEPPPPAPAVSRADALVDDLARRQAAYDEAEKAQASQRAAAAASVPIVSEYGRPAALASADPAAPVAASGAAGATAFPEAATTAGGHDEAWWKSQMRALQVKLEDDTRKMQGAAIAVGDATLRITQDQANTEFRQRQAEVNADRDAINRLHEDARRANVPPGWLRYP